jgi:hypothetical protein
MSRQGQRLSAGLLATVMAMPAAAQNTTAPPIITLPGVQNYSLPPGTPTPTPTPTPIPTATPAAPPPLVARTVPTPAASPTSRATPTPAPAATPAPSPSPAPAPLDAPAAAPTITPAGSPAPASVATPSPTPIQSVAPEGGGAWWPWLLGALILIGGAAVVLRRRRAPDPAGAGEQEFVAAEPPEQVAPAPLTNAPAPAAPTIELRPVELATQGPDALLRFELLLRNDGEVPLEGVRPVVVLGSAGPDLATEIARFHAGAPTMNAAAQFDLAPGDARRLNGELVLPGTAMHVREVNDRAMIVPVVLVDVRWRSGLSVRADGAAFLIGTGSSDTPKLGPVWVDRSGQRFTRLDARRFTPEPR